MNDQTELERLKAEEAEAYATWNAAWDAAAAWEVARDAAAAAAAAAAAYTAKKELDK